MTVSSIAGRLGVTDLEAAELLPEVNCTFVKGDITERFTEIWAELASWEKITLSFSMKAASLKFRAAP